jgi:hypothetical protein
MNKEITDRPTIKKLLDALFKSNPIFMEVSGESVPVKFIDFKTDGVLIRASKTDPDNLERILTVTNRENIFYFYFTEIDTDDFGNLHLKNNKVIIKDLAGLNKDILFEVTNITTPLEIFKALNDEKVSQLIKRAPKISFMFNFFEVYISERPNSRMRLIAHHDKPIFIPNIMTPELVKPEFVPFADYISMTKNSGVLDKFKAEICVPIKYKNFILIGYAHAMHNTRLDYNSYNTFKLVASSVIRDVHTSGIFDETKEICPIIEYTKNSIRFLHPPTRQANKLFSVGSQIIFDLIARGGNKKFVRAIVKAIKPTQKDFSITCEFQGIPNHEVESFQDFIATHSMEN